MRVNKEAATVALNLGDIAELLDKANHLAAIHKAPSTDWAWLVGELF